MKRNLWKKATSVAMSIVLAMGLCPALALANEGDLQAAGQAITALDNQTINQLENGKYTVDLKNSLRMTKFSDHDDPSLAPYVVVDGENAYLVVFYQQSSSKSAWRYDQIKWGAYDEIDQSIDGFVGVPIYKEGKSEADGNSDDTVYAMKFVMDIPTIDLIAAVNNAEARPYTVKYVSDYKDADLAGKWWKASSPTTFTLSNLVKVSDSTDTAKPPVLLSDGVYSLPEMKSAPGELFNHMIADSRQLTVEGDKATISFTQDGSTKSVAKYSRIALGKTSELVSVAYQPELPEGTTIIEGVNAGEGENGAQWAYDVKLSKSKVASLLEGECLYIVIWNSQGASSNGNVPGWYQSKEDQYLSLGSLGIKTYDPVVALANAKNVAIDELSKYADSKAYRPAQKAEVDKEVAAGNAAISAAANVEAVNSALAAAKAAISQIKTDAQLTDEEQAAAEAAAKAAATAGLEVGKSETAGTGASAATVKATSADAVTYVAPAKKSTTSVTVPDTVTVNGKQYKVTKVASNAFKGSKAKSVKVGKNVTTLSSNAFKGAKNLKKVTIASKNLKSKKAVKNAFKGSKVKTVVLKGMTAKQKKAVKKAILKYGGKKVTVK